MGFSDFFIDVESLPQDGYGLFQLLCVGGVYGYILMFASNLISDGSELLLLVPSMAGIVGSVVLPILGAVPDGCMVFFSGMGPNAQEQLNVGVGALAGSTIMLLTVPWFLSILGGRVDIDEKTQRPRYRQPKLTGSGSSGVALSPVVNATAYTMLLTASSYLLLQIPGLLHLRESFESVAAAERTWAMLGAFVCLFFFGRYLYQQYQQSEDPNTVQEISREDLLRQAIAKKEVSLAGVMIAELDEYRHRGAHRARADSYDATIEEGIALKDKSPSRYSSLRSTAGGGERKPISEEFLLHLERILKPFYFAYDFNGNGSLDLKELRAVFGDLGEELSEQQLEDVFHEFDTNANGQIDYVEFVRGVAKYIDMHESIIAKKNHGSAQRWSTSYNRQDYSSSDIVVSEDALEAEEEEEMPEDIKHLSPDEQQRRVKMRAGWMLGLGTLLVLIISDPMVDVMSEVGKRTNIPGFYIAFVFAPLASNASELIAAYNYSLKKTVSSITISLTTLEGACIMNNTFVLGIFMVLIWTQNLAWQFFAETLTILFVQVIIALLALKSKHTMTDAWMILALYPLSLGMVAALEKMGWN